MKRLLFLLFILSYTSFSLHAQKIIQWDIAEPILGAIMGVSFDYSETDFNGVDYETFIVVSKFDRETLEESENRFINGFNNGMRDKKFKFYLSRDENSNCPYTFVVHPKRFSKFGSFLVSLQS